MTYMAIISYILNFIFASRFITHRGGDIEKYHDALDEMKKTVKHISLDANSCWGCENDNSEKNGLLRQITTELHHLVGECQSFNKNYNNFKYDKCVSKSLDVFRKEATGAGNKTNKNRIDNIDGFSVQLCQVIDECKIRNKWRFAIKFWSKI